MQCCVYVRTCAHMQVYAATRSRILSSANAYYFSGSAFTGLGSPHTPHRYIWPLAHMVDALTTEPTPEGACTCHNTHEFRIACTKGYARSYVYVEIMSRSCCCVAAPKPFSCCSRHCCHRVDLARCDLFFLHQCITNLCCSCFNIQPYAVAAAVCLQVRHTRLILYGIC